MNAEHDIYNAFLTLALAYLIIESLQLLIRDHCRRVKKKRTAKHISR